MEDLKQKAKMSVLQELIKMMDEKESENLKSLSPKFAKVDIQSDDPALADKLKDKLTSGMHEDAEEIPEHEVSESKSFESQEDDEDLEKLKEMYSRLK